MTSIPLKLQRTVVFSAAIFFMMNPLRAHSPELCSGVSERYNSFFLTDRRIPGSSAPGSFNVPVASADTVSGRSRLGTVEIGICGSAMLPILAASDNWKPYETVGFYCILPSAIPNLSCMLSAEGGVVNAKKQETEVQCLHLRVGVCHIKSIRTSIFSLRPQIGLSSMMVGGGDGLIDLTKRHVFGHVENEYGVYVGCEPRFFWKRCNLAFPVRFERVLSSPDRFDVLSVSCMFGYEIRL